MRGGKSDAGGPEKQLILFVWPNVEYDDLYQKIARKLNRNYFFGLSSISINFL